MLLGLDVGTSSIKAMLYDPDGHHAPVVVKERLDILHPDLETAELDAEALWETVCRLLSALRRCSPRAAWEGLAGMGISVIFPALVPMSDDGRALHAAILYCDRRSLPQVEQLAATYGRQAMESRTGNRLTPGTCTLPGLLWLRQHEPEIFSRTHVFGQLSTFLVRKLTGETVLDYTHASLSGLCRAGEEDRWDPEMLQLAGVDEDRLPRLRPSTACAGLTSGPGARACGLRPGIPVAVGSGDAPLAAFGGGVIGPGKLFISAGTTDCIMLSAPKPCGNTAFCQIHAATPGPLWLVNGTMSSAGASVEWFCRSFSRCDPATMSSWAAEAPPGSRGVVYLPYLQGERTPWWDPRARGVLYGLTLQAGREDAARAVFEGIACGWRQIVSLLEKELGVRPEEIVAVGGGMSNPLWNRIKASALQRPVTVLDVPEITSLGAALCGGMCAGCFASAVEAVRSTEVLRRIRTFEPVREWAEAAEASQVLYERLYPALAPLFQTSSDVCRDPAV